MRARLSVAALAMLLAGCAQQPPLINATASGHPEGTFEGAPLDVVRNKLIGACSRAGLNVGDIGSNQVICEKTMGGTASMLTQLMIGNSYSTTPTQKVRFILYEEGGSVHVTANEWVETQMAFGQVRTVELTGAAQQNEVQQMLYNIGARNDALAAPHSVEAQQVAAELLSAPPRHPANEGVGKTYQVDVPLCDVRGAPDGAVTAQYPEGTLLHVYARKGEYARVTPDSAPTQWVVFALLRDVK
jgi:hypothetical protein